MKKNALFCALMIAFAAQARASILEDVGECLDKSVKHAYITAKAAASIAEMLADPVLGLCVTQVLLPDPLTIAGAGAVVAVAAATSIAPGQCDAGLRDKAFDPLIDALSGLTGLKRQNEPLASLISQGKDMAWDYLKNTPPTALVWSKLSCGCTFYDKGTAIEDIKKVAEATTAAGKSCGKVLGQAAGAVGSAVSWLGGKVKCGMEEVDKLLNAEGPLDSPYDFYLRVWKPFEQGYVYLNLKGKTLMDTSLPAALQFGDEAAAAVFAAFGTLQVGYGTPQSLDQLRARTRAYYECVDSSWKTTNQINDWFFKSADAKLAVAKAWLSFEAKAKAARAQKAEEYLQPYEESGVVSTLTLNAIDTTLREWTKAGWKAYQPNISANADDVLALTFNQFKPKLDALKKQAEEDIKQAKSKDFVAPLRRLVADGNLQKLEQLGEEKGCDGMHALLAAECKRDTDAVRQAAREVLKQRDNKKNWTMTEAANYGKADGGKQLTRNSRYTYAPIIPDPRDDAAWADNAKYNAVLKADSDLRESFIGKLKAAAAPYPGLQDRLDKLVGVYEAGCGEAIGKPGSTATPMCREHLAQGVAACLVNGMRKAAKAATPAAPLGQVQTAPSALDQVQTAQSALSAVQTPASLSGAGLPKNVAVSECDASAKNALARYAMVHKQAPDRDRSVTNYFSGLKPMTPASQRDTPGRPLAGAPETRESASPSRTRLLPGGEPTSSGRGDETERRPALRTPPAADEEGARRGQALSGLGRPAPETPEQGLAQPGGLRQPSASGGLRPPTTPAMPDPLAEGRGPSPARGGADEPSAMRGVTTGRLLPPPAAGVAPPQEHSAGGPRPPAAPGGLRPLAPPAPPTAPTETGGLTPVPLPASERAGAAEPVPTPGVSTGRLLPPPSAGAVTSPEAPAGGLRPPLAPTGVLPPTPLPAIPTEMRGTARLAPAPAGRTDTDASTGIRQSPPDPLIAPPNTTGTTAPLTRPVESNPIMRR